MQSNDIIVSANMKSKQSILGLSNKMENENW